MSILPIVMGETLAVGGTEVDMLGHLTGTDMRVCWQDAIVLPTLIRDKQVLNAVVAELAGTEVAEANAGATAKVQRGILTDCLTGRSEEHTSELQSLMRISYAVFCLKKKN